MTALRVLYVHGLESGPTGRKVTLLQAGGAEVVARQMPCGRRQALLDVPVIAWALVSVEVVVMTAVSFGPLGGLAGVATVVVSAVLLRPLLIRRVFRRSVAVQRALLSSERIDVVVGSSFGGAVSLELLRSGAWKGPTVLLCPAHQNVERRAFRGPSRGLDGLPAELTAQVVVVHAVQDAVVPVADSRRLVSGTSARLITVDDDHRLSASATEASLREWVSMARAGARGVTP